MSEKTQLEMDKDDVAIIIGKTDKETEYSISLNVPTHLEEKLQKTEEDVPPYILVAFQICQYISNPENLAKMDEYFANQVAMAESDMETK